MTGRILIKVSVTEYCIKFRVICPAAKLDRSFEMFPMDFEKLGHQTTVVVNDSSSFAVLRKEQFGDTLSIRFVWLSSYGDGPVTGQEQTVKLPFSELCSFVKAGAKEDSPSEWAILSLEHRSRPRLVFCEQENLHAVVTNKKVRRKLVRFLRDHFQWPGTDEIQFCNDSMPYSFFFRELCNGQVGMCQSPAVMERWALKIQGLEQHKRHYEQVLRRELDGLDDEFGTLKFLGQELQARAQSIRFQKQKAA